MGLLVAMFGFIIEREMGTQWNSAPFIITCTMILVTIIIVSSNPIYKYLCQTSTKKRTIIISIIVLIVSIISIILHIVFFIQYGS